MTLTKQTLLTHYQDTMDFVRGLEHIPEEAWRTPYAEGKWTVAEIIGHLSPWDRFLVAERLPYILANEPFRVKPDSEAVNEEAAKMSREQQRILTIDEFLVSRDRLHRAVELIPEDRLTDTFTSKGKTISLLDFLGAMMQHDLHHRAQIEQVTVA
ncbi:DinB family protein [Exiguobacterium sp. Helios]|uniref:DinB family protein n=1 Tax=unclassified Exiguobacterium TaxID=2644629 RepID=UPI00103AC15C|nr:MULTISPECIES: DinB family protein [unclassified Exiguobacterium]QNR19685.1 DinB family protein [Exiguobacterium sp. Helios]